jgi:hypothetical protein
MVKRIEWPIATTWPALKPQGKMILSHKRQNQMQLPDSTSKAADYLKNIFESGKVLKLSEPHGLNGTQSFLFVVSA